MLYQKDIHLLKPDIHLNTSIMTGTLPDSLPLSMKSVLRKAYGSIRSIPLKFKTRHGNTIVRRKIPDSDLYLYSKRSHVRSNEHEIIRIAEYVSRCEGELIMVDVGANIGVVTLLTYKALSKGTFLCIDGNDDFFPLLQKNMAQIPHSTCEKRYLSDQVEQKSMQTKTYLNTANLLENPAGKPTDFCTLDAICDSKCLHPNFIKIDTDGYDSKVLRGFSTHLSTDEHMVVYFEYAPMHQVFNNIENEPLIIFDQLFQWGYEDYYFYDERGSYVCSVHYTERIRIKELTQYCLSSCKLYNVLTFHKKNTKFKEIYALGEAQHQKQSIQDWAAWWAKH
jgi:FkbM family methyltransferase